ncbi:hypothetical protein Cgig2_020697 [Carnegiea gigantea]|uniref:Importin N-terminal domain-containing protein n=1 Tax=Carnegiea gigantea TaxID=171969 RepID=A0A9Q1GMM3_9CARY|nr:hypothetical protein Cgig2_020697 [Carnegiea gigantea]
MFTEDVLSSALLNETLSFDGEVVHKATLQLDGLSVSSDFPLCLLALVSGGGNKGQKLAAATYFKNLIRRNVYVDGQSAPFTDEFKDRLLESLLRAELPVLKVLVEAFRLVVDAEFVKKDLWPELVPRLMPDIIKSALRIAGCSTNISQSKANSSWLKAAKNKLIKAFGSWVIDTNVPFTVVDSVYINPLWETIREVGPDVRASSSYELSDDISLISNTCIDKVKIEKTEG